MTPTVQDKLGDLYGAQYHAKKMLNMMCDKVGMYQSYTGNALSGAIDQYVKACVAYEVYNVCSSPEFFNMIVSGASDVEDTNGLQK
jgi:hypothetical protein